MRDAGGKSSPLDKIFAEVVTLLSKRNYSTASARLAALRTAIAQEETKLASSVVIPANVPAIKEAPSNGYRRQSVETLQGGHMISRDMAVKLTNFFGNPCRKEFFHSRAVADSRCPRIRDPDDWFRGCHAHHHLRVFLPQRWGDNPIIPIV